MKEFIIIMMSLLSLSPCAVAMEDFLLEGDTVAVPNQELFIRNTIFQQYVDSLRENEIQRLTEEDYCAVASELGIEVAAIKAVVEIETGRQHNGFCAPHMPIIDFDEKVFRRFCSRRKISLVKYNRNTGTQSSRQMREHKLLQNACKVDSVTAYECTFWGMFQIGGFNWKLCGAENIQDFVDKMSRSERSQLELFAQFIKGTGMVELLRSKKWGAFAYRYNGPKYAQHGYHTRLARAYAKYSS